ncbi:MAG TPA: DUF4157 domain-containing protein [Candidatus Eisenbacteria bacterium]|nr:DUF4157 domain-containing protein [Candidatus Eisenbacteria bacterium]
MSRRWPSTPFRDGEHPVPPVVHDVLRSAGRPLDFGTRKLMEDRFGHEFTRVRVHTGPRAAESLRLVNAEAYSVGHAVVLGDPFDAETPQGRAIVAHELAHVVQADRGSRVSRPLRFGGDNDSPAEREAEQAARQVVRGVPVGRLSADPGSSIQRKLRVKDPKKLIDNPTGTGLVQGNAETVQGYLRTLAPDGTPTVDAASGDVSLAGDFCTTPGFLGRVGRGALSGLKTGAKIGVYGLGVGAIPGAILGGLIGGVAGIFDKDTPAQKSDKPTGSTCLCDIVGSPNQFTIVVDDKDWPHTLGRVVTTPSPNSPKLWGAATVSAKTTTIDPWLVLP